jgi:hypothetical protein
MTVHAGSCLCGAVAFEIDGAPGLAAACHCGQCRKWSGNIWASVAPAAGTLRVLSDTGLAWYRSSGTAERGFCRICGSSLFWRRLGADRIDVAAGTLDSPTGAKLARHIFVTDKGDYYTIADGLPQVEES